MINFLEETREYIFAYGYKTEDIIFIGSMESGHQCSWEEFKVLADKDYDDGFGGVYVARDLIIVFFDKRIMYRHEYDGAERWEMIKEFTYPAKKLKIKSLFSEYGDNEFLVEINE